MRCPRNRRRLSSPRQPPPSWRPGARRLESLSLSLSGAAVEPREFRAREVFRTFGGIGKERPILEAGREVELFRHAGAGCLTHMWFAMDVGTRICVYVDGEVQFFYGQLGLLPPPKAVPDSGFRAHPHAMSRGTASPLYRFHDHDPVFFHDGLRLAPMR